MTRPQDKMRAEFEATMRAEPHCWMNRDFHKSKTEGQTYEDFCVEVAWKTWQAACAQQSAQSQQEALDASRWRAVTHQPGLDEIFLCKFGICEGLDESLYGEEAEQEVDAAIAAQGASNV